ncbi:MAG: 4Fe-4S dicluster domain-containing protein [Candidatus Aminicenantes bacterium]|nr:4Fe-4S dicluster domain-containing protein [Candidatus Aminicenantes bacterium]
MSRSPDHPIRVNLEKCGGCVHCLTACPTRAIRVRDNKAQVLGDLCIDCGECIRYCPNDAIESRTTSFSDLRAFRYKVAIPATVLYGQFGNDTTPNEVLSALRHEGFDQVFELSSICELYASAAEEYLAAHPQPRPLISTTCPVVVRLIQRRYPSLCGLIVPIEPPREIAAKILRATLPGVLKLAPEEIGLIHITPCPAKIVSINRPATMAKSYLDGAISIRDIYPRLLQALKKIDESTIMHHLFPANVFSGLGLGWSLSGGETRGLKKHRTIAVSGVRDTIRVLDQVEAGQLKDVDYLECMVCPDGCVGGPLAVENRFITKSRILRLVSMASEKVGVERADFGPFVRENFLSFQHPVKPIEVPLLDPDPVEAIRKATRRDELLRLLPGKDCGACGAPDCLTLAEDIVRGLADLDDCPLFRKEIR